MGDIGNFKGKHDMAGPLGHPGWSWRQRLTQKDWLWRKEWQKKNQSCFLVEGKMIGKIFGGQLWP